MKLKRASYRHIEAEIYSYHDTLREIEIRRAEIMLAGREEETVAVSGGGFPGSQVERRATKLADSILLREMERVTGVIADIYARTRDEARKIIWVKYGLALNWHPPGELLARMQNRNRFDMSARDMAEALTVDESTFHRYRTGFVYGVADKLGWW